MWMPVAPLGGSHADRNARGIRRDARPSQPGRLRGGGKRLLGVGERGRYLLAATFGNVHGVYQPGHVKLRPKLLDEIQRAVAARVGRERPFDLVFHGGSGSLPAEIREAVSYGVVKMNLDTDMQYAFTRPIADHMFTRYDGVLRVDGQVADKRAYDPRGYLAKAETSMAARVVQACNDLGSAGTSLMQAG